MFRASHILPCSSREQKKCSFMSLVIILSSSKLDVEQMSQINKLTNLWFAFGVDQTKLIK